MTPKSLRKILVIDDDEFIQQLLKDTLISEQYEVLVAGSVEESYYILKKTIPDLIVLDIILPGKDGFEFCKVLRKSRETHDIPILILSSKHSVSDRVKGLELGADDYLVKPFHLEELVARVHALFRRYDRIKVNKTEKIRGISAKKVEKLKKITDKIKIPEIVLSPVHKESSKQKEEDFFLNRKKQAMELFRNGLFEESLQVFEELSSVNKKDLEVKRYKEIVKNNMMKKYLSVFGGKDVIPVRTSDRLEDFIGLDFNTEEGFLFSRVDGTLPLKTIVSMSGMNPLKAYRILYNLYKSGVIQTKKQDG